MPAMRQAGNGRTRATSPRQLPTDHDHVGGLHSSIHEYQNDQPSLQASPAVARIVSSISRARTVSEREKKIGVDKSHHISRLLKYDLEARKSAFCYPLPSIGSQKMPIFVVSFPFSTTCLSKRRANLQALL